MAGELGKVSTHPDPVDGLSRGIIQHFSWSLPPQKVALISQKMNHVRTLFHLSASSCLSLIGTMSSCILMLPWAHWHLRFFSSGVPDTVEETVTEAMDIPHEPHEEESSVVNKEISDLKAATSAVPLLNHTYYRRKHKRLGSALQSICNPKEMGFSHYRDSLEHTGDAGDLALQHKPLLLRMDNRAAVFFIQRQGGTCSTLLLREVEPIML